MKNITSEPDEKIVKLARTINKELYSEIIRRYQDKLFRYASYLVGDDSDAADIVQNAFIKAYINLNGFDVHKKFSSWIYRIVHNEAMNKISQSRKQVSMNAVADFDSGINLEDDLVRKELKHHAHYCLNRIPVIYSEPLSLYFFEDKSYEEISDILRIPTGTVGTRINRGKIIMKKICKRLNK